MAVRLLLADCYTPFIGNADRRTEQVHETARCPSVRLSQHDGRTAANPLLQVCCCAPGGQEISIDC